MTHGVSQKRALEKGGCSCFGCRIDGSVAKPEAERTYTILRHAHLF